MPESPKQAAIAKVLGESRWRILGELCRRPQTASELAEEVKTSANAVRVHLDALQDAGLVAYEVERRQVGKPVHVYALTDAAQALISRAYAPALAAVLSAAREKMNGSFLPMLRRAGATLAKRQGSRGSEASGVAAAARLLEELGAITDVEESNGLSVVQTTCCPLGALTRDSTEVCSMMESALKTASGMKTRYQCKSGGDHPRCRFEFTM